MSLLPETEFFVHFPNSCCLPRQLEKKKYCFFLVQDWLKNLHKSYIWREVSFVLKKCLPGHRRNSYQNSVYKSHLAKIYPRKRAKVCLQIKIETCHLLVYTHIEFLSLFYSHNRQRPSYCSILIDTPQVESSGSLFPSLCLLTHPSGSSFRFIFLHTKSLLSINR